MEINSLKYVKAIIACLFFTVQAAYGLSVPTPKHMQLSWVGQELNHNGVPVNILHFSTDKSTGSVLEYYRDIWSDPVSDTAPGFIENTVAQWQVVSRLEGGSNLVVQVKSRNDGGAEGYISQMHFSSRIAIKDAQNFPRPRDSVLVSHTQGDDFKGDALTLVITSEMSVSAVARYYLNTLKSKGYKAQFDQEDSGSRALFFVGKGKKIDVSVGPIKAGGTAIFVNVLKE